MVRSYTVSQCTIEHHSTGTSPRRSCEHELSTAEECFERPRTFSPRSLSSWPIKLCRARHFVLVFDLDRGHDAHVLQHVQEFYVCCGAWNTSDMIGNVETSNINVKNISGPTDSVTISVGSWWCMVRNWFQCDCHVGRTVCFDRIERYAVFNHFVFSCFNHVTKIRRRSLTHTARKYFGNQRSNENSNMTKTRTPTLEHRCLRENWRIIKLVYLTPSSCPSSWRRFERNVQSYWHVRFLTNTTFDPFALSVPWFLFGSSSTFAYHKEDDINVDTETQVFELISLCLNLLLFGQNIGVFGLPQVRRSVCKHETVFDVLVATYRPLDAA